MRFFESAFAASAATALLAASLSASAHHSFAGQFDRNQPVSFEGVVTLVEWQNPHVWFYVDAEGMKKETLSIGKQKQRIRTTCSDAGGNTTTSKSATAFRSKVFVLSAARTS